MKCCKQSQTNKENDLDQGQQHGRGGGLKHRFRRLTCCLAPLGVVLFINQSGYDGVASYLVLLLCPLMHLLMMRGMGHKHKDKESSDENNIIK